jgi:hypothetical protein
MTDQTALRVAYEELEQARSDFMGLMREVIAGTKPYAFDDFLPLADYTSDSIPP